jgi:N-acetyl-gamma-glutamyl-phosphate reductase
MIRVSIIGATGYTGGELLRYLLRHPEVKLAHLTSENYAGQPVHGLHKFLKGRCGIVLEKANPATIAADSDLVFLGLPHGTAAKTAAALIQKGVKVIDLSADFRIQNLSVYEKWYGKHAAPKLIKNAVYGLPERYREQIADAQLIAAPGCYSTTSILAGLPLVTDGLVGNGPIIIDAKSGVSGAGRKVEAMYLFAEDNENLQAYALKGHRHQPEILQEWNRAVEDRKTARKRGGKAVTSSRPRLLASSLIFVPHLIPMNRGIFVTLYAPLAKKLSAEALRQHYLDYYLREPFVSVLGVHESPETKGVAFTNHCQIGVSVDPSGRNAIILAVTDNLGKGASGQAIQCMNLMFGLDETTGLL